MWICGGCSLLGHLRGFVEVLNERKKRKESTFIHFCTEGLVGELKIGYDTLDLRRMNGWGTEGKRMDGWMFGGGGKGMFSRMG